MGKLPDISLAIESCLTRQRVSVGLKDARQTKRIQGRTVIDVISRQAQQPPPSPSPSTSPSPESFHHLREPLRLELVIDRRPRGEDGPLAVHFGAHEGGTTADSVEVERFGNGDGGGGGGAGVEKSGGES